MADWGIKISKPGYDVKTCTKDQLVFDSELDTMKVAYSDAPTGAGSYTHGLGYAPAFLVSAEQYFVGQIFSAFELPFVSTSTIFYYYSACRYWLFHQQGSS